MPTGVVLDCRNTTFNSRNVTLSWSPPTRDLQNGMITGYELFCYEIQSNTLVPDTNDTLDSPDTTYTVPVITPFRSYNCGIAAISSEGVGPFSNCLFNSAQDGQSITVCFIVCIIIMLFFIVPSDSPGNFASLESIDKVTFSWITPKSPNGVIIEYRLTITLLNIEDDEELDYFINSTQSSITISGYVPNQAYSASIAARTVAGYGPEAIINGRTKPDC